MIRLSVAKDFSICTAIVIACTLVNWLLSSWLSATDAAMVYLLGVMVAAIFLARSASIVTALLSFLAFDFFFVPPILTLRFASTQYLTTALVLLIVGLVISGLVSRVRREIETSATAEIAARDERIRSSLLASISHDLRTPLAVIAGTASSLRDNRDRLSPEEQDLLLDTIFQRSARMTVEVSDLLEITRLHTGRVTMDRQWYPLEELIGAAIERCRNLLDGHALSVSLPQELCLLYVDGVLIEKLFVNLLENACLHTSADTCIDVSASRDGDIVIVYVRDNGPGIPVGREESIFAMFDRGTRAGIGAGSGLGLSICRSIADLHGLTVKARNRAEGGSEFSISFPVHHPPQIPSSE